jgi:hypothetical protein
MSRPALMSEAVVEIKRARRASKDQALARRPNIPTNFSNFTCEATNMNLENA